MSFLTNKFTSMWVTLREAHQKLHKRDNFSFKLKMSEKLQSKNRSFKMDYTWAEASHNKSSCDWSICPESWIDTFGQ